MLLATVRTRSQRPADARAESGCMAACCCCLRRRASSPGSHTNKSAAACETRRNIKRPWRRFAPVKRSATHWASRSATHGGRRGNRKTCISTCKDRRATPKCTPKSRLAQGKWDLIQLEVTLEPSGKRVLVPLGDGDDAPLFQAVPPADVAKPPAATPPSHRPRIQPSRLPAVRDRKSRSKCRRRRAAGCGSSVIAAALPRVRQEFMAESNPTNSPAGTGGRTVWS